MECKNHIIWTYRSEEYLFASFAKCNSYVLLGKILNYRHIASTRVSQLLMRDADDGIVAFGIELLEGDLEKRVIQSFRDRDSETPNYMKMLNA